MKFRGSQNPIGSFFHQGRHGCWGPLHFGVCEVGPSLPDAASAHSPREGWACESSHVPWFEASVLDEVTFIPIQWFGFLRSMILGLRPFYYRVLIVTHVPPSCWFGLVVLGLNPSFLYSANEKPPRNLQTANPKHQSDGSLVFGLVGLVWTAIVSAQAKRTMIVHGTFFPA